MAIGAIVGGALSGISNLFGARSQNQSVDKQLAAAREEADTGQRHGSRYRCAA